MRVGALREECCVPLSKGSTALPAEEQELLGVEVPGWGNLDGKWLVREYRFKRYTDGSAWVQQVVLLAEKEDHHPDIHLFYCRVVLELWTHTVGGISRNDFILAAKLDALFEAFAASSERGVSPE